MDAGNSLELIGFEGNIGNIKMVISTTKISLLDTEISGNKEISTVNGTSVIAGYFVTDPNRQRGTETLFTMRPLRWMAARYILKMLAQKPTAKTTKNQLAEVIQKLIENGELDITPYLDREVGTDLDGSPDGYDPLPNARLLMKKYQNKTSKPIK